MPAAFAVNSMMSFKNGLLTGKVFVGYMKFLSMHFFVFKVTFMKIFYSSEVIVVVLLGDLL